MIAVVIGSVSSWSVAAAQSAVARVDTIVRDAGAAVYRDGGRLVPVATLSDSAHRSGAVSTGAVTADGNLVVVHRSSYVRGDDNMIRPSGEQPTVREYDRTGRVVRTFGRVGNAPGEYLRPTAVAVGRDGRVFVHDPQLMRIIVYARDGKHVADWPLFQKYVWYTPTMVVDTTGLLYVPITMQPDSLLEMAFARVRTTNGTIADTIYPPSIAGDTAAYYSVRRMTGGPSAARRGSRAVAVPFRAQPLSTLSPLGGFVTANPARYHFESVSPPNPASTTFLRSWVPAAPVLSVRRNAASVTVTAEERIQHVRAIEEYLRWLDPTWDWKGPTMPFLKAAFNALTVGSDGRVWIRPSVAAVDMPATPRDSSTATSGIGRREPHAFDVFDNSGRYFGRVVTNEELHPIAARGDTLWAISGRREPLPRASDTLLLKRFHIVWSPIR
jgi:hypothetical protein